MLTQCLLPHKLTRLGTVIVWLSPGSVPAQQKADEQKHKNTTAMDPKIIARIPLTVTVTHPSK